MAEVVIDTGSFSASKPGANITGAIHLQCGDDQFPDARWNDFPVIVLAWWLKGLLSLVRGQASECEAFFMDGPYRFTVRLIDGQTARITFKRAGGLTEKDVAFSALFASVAVAGAAAVHECRARGWDNSDLDELAQLVAQASI
ncbi:hypothetical protein ACG04R_26795 [Roseateles sp. BYS78W]|uniref:Uncharacterized protein n=1 Tax=Pelomonas candidula TaxID=3299025 RepID=A0ABW7HK52_9BURK